MVIRAEMVLIVGLARVALVADVAEKFAQGIGGRDILALWSVSMRRLLFVEQDVGKGVFEELDLLEAC